jgi:hypothetical protein
MDDVTIHDDREITGGYVQLPLKSVSYYPTEEVAKRIALNIYGVDLHEKGLFSSQKYQMERTAMYSHVNPDSPLSHCHVEGDFILFLPHGKLPWGLMDIRRIISPRPDVNLSIVSPLALMPHPLHVVRGGIEDKAHPLFVVVDRDGSKWTLHCKFTDLQKSGC